MHPEIIPPFEFSADTQDCIRIFAGGKRVAVTLDIHTKYNVPLEAYSKIRKYVNKYINNISPSTYQLLNPAFYVAGYFLTEFFTKEHDYTKLPSDSFIIDSYRIS